MEFIKSSLCDGGTCAEVAFTPDMVYLRSNRDPGKQLAFTPAEWDAFIEGAKLGEFRRQKAVVPQGG